MFLESLYREVLVLWCLKNTRCVEFCLSEIFQYKTIAASYKAWTLRCSLEGTQTLNTPINSTQIPFEKLLRHPPYISRHHRTLNDAVRHQQTPANVIQCQPEQQHILKLSFKVLGTVSCCLVVSVVVLNCPEIPGGGDCEHMGEVYVCLWGLDVC